MIVLHGSWLGAQSTTNQRGFIIWAETDRVAEMSMRRDLTQLHPFAVSGRALRHALTAAVLGDSDLKHLSAEFTATIWLPSVDDAPLPSNPILQPTNGATAASEPQLTAWQVEALLFEPHAAPGLLASLLPEQENVPGVQLGADLKFWRAAGRLALEFIARQRFIPALIKRDQEFLGVWEPLLDEPNDQARVERLIRAMPPLARAVTGRLASTLDAPSPRLLLNHFLQTVIDDFARRYGKPYNRESQRSSRHIPEMWLQALGNPDPVLQGSEAELSNFYDYYHAWVEMIPGVTGGEPFRLCFRLEPPLTSSTADDIHVPASDAHDWTLRYLLQATDDPSLLVDAGTVWRERGSTLRFLNRTFDAPQERLLAGLGHASRLFSPIDASLREARPEKVALTAEQAHTFLSETALLLRSFGFGVLIPTLQSKLGVRVRLKTPPVSPKGGVAGISFDSLVNYDWELALGDLTLSRAEFEKLAALKTPLVEIRGQWVELRPDQLQQALKFWDKTGGRMREGKQISAHEALRLALGVDAEAAQAGLPVAKVVADGWLGDLLSQLTTGVQVQPVPLPPDFHGVLRQYQEVGVSWMAFLRTWGLGACLADDMGLGKTPQTIALLLHARAQDPANDHPSLVICPTSVVSNWQRELERFSPDLSVYVHHGAGRKKQDLAAHAALHDVVLSSYPLLQRDAQHLTAIPWGNVILDEAQNIKNPDTKQAQTARKLNAQWRLALTGTPVENRLSELWSIFQFINPGYLGSQAEFQRALANPIERAGDATAQQHLRALTAPFILRRVKTDPTVISDLPAKNEMKVLVNLTREQATLYEAVVRESIKRIEQSNGIARRGIVLSTLLRLKQVCNHPAQYLGDGSALGGRSGKLARLQEMLEEVRTVREHALIFTQFAEMGKLLQTYLQDTFGDETLFLYGATPTKARTQMIERFQTDPHGPLFFILSLKAGGTGLNLTRANHVFHFDRWWNPAVENQATDRAFRIGQTRNVQVYKYLCAGTFEEQIDAMIERKQSLAQSIVGTSESWLTELSTDELRELFRLRKDAIGD